MIIPHLVQEFALLYILKCSSLISIPRSTAYNIAFIAEMEKIVQSLEP